MALFHPHLVLTQVSALTVLVLTIHWAHKYMGGFGSDKSILFNYHPVLMVTAFVVFGMEGVIMYRVGPGSRPLRKVLHVLCNTAALIVGTVGVYIVFDFHKKNGFPDFYSTHSWMGMATSVVFVLQYLVGFTFFVIKFGTPAMRAAVLPAHQYFGLVSHGLAVATIITGIFEKQTFFPDLSKFSPDKVWANWIAMSVAFATIVAMGHLKAQEKLPAEPSSVNSSRHSLLGHTH